MASFTAALQVDPWVRMTPQGYKTIGGVPLGGEKEAGTGSKQNPLTPTINIAVARYYPDWAKARAREAGYIVDDATPDYKRPEVEDPTIVASPMIETSRNYAPWILKAFREAAGTRLTIPG
jgi:hypothetical protein